MVRLPTEWANNVKVDVRVKSRQLGCWKLQHFSGLKKSTKIGSEVMSKKTSEKGSGNCKRVNRTKVLKRLISLVSW